MTGDNASTTATTETAGADAPAAGSGPATGAGTAVGTGTAVGPGAEDAEELLVEEISIDGMCGVY